MSLYTSPVSVSSRYISKFDTGGMPKNGDAYQYSLRIVELNTKILNQEFVSIIQSKDLFWQTFCVAYLKVKKGGSSENYESVGVSGHEQVCKEIQTCVEAIRKIFFKHQKNSTDFLVIPVYRGGYCHFISKAPRRYVNLSCKASSITYEHFLTFVKPTLHTLCHMLNCSSQEQSFCFSVKLWEEMPPMLDKYQAIEVRWLQNPL